MLACDTATPSESVFKASGHLPACRYIAPFTTSVRPLRTASLGDGDAGAADSIIEYLSRLWSLDGRPELTLDVDGVDSLCGTLFCRLLDAAFGEGDNGIDIRSLALLVTFWVPFRVPAEITIEGDSIVGSSCSVIARSCIAFKNKMPKSQTTVFMAVVCESEALGTNMTPPPCCA